ncbi:MAG: HlyD family efflux transporter periplasmic adaptor subunit [Ruminococcus sp.]|nr:HlyD family efflux transporter periplasmic adaptor subunit [Ruminococcus sp.]
MNESTELKEIKEIKGDPEKRDPRRKRETIKTILIIFLVVLLLLTFFSNTIMNRSLAEITTERVSSGKLTERVRGGGVIESNQTYEVTIDGNKSVDKIMIKAGQTVNADDVLFVVGGSPSEELTAAEDQLATLQLNYSKALLTPAADYSSEDKEIANAQEDLNALIAKRDAAKIRESGAQAALDQYNSSKAQLADKTSQSERVSATIAAIDADDYTTASPEYLGDLVSLQSECASAESEYSAAYELYSRLLTEGAAEEALTAAQEDMDAKSARRDEAKNSYSGAKSTKRSELSATLAQLQSDISYLSSYISAYEASLSDPSESYESLAAQVTEKQRYLENLMITLAKTKTTDENTAALAALDLEAMQTEITKQEEKVAKLREESGATEIKSKYSGVVSSVYVQPGDTTTPGNALASIDISEEGYTLKVTVDGAKASKVKIGTAAEVMNNWNGDVQAVLSEIKNDSTPGSKNRVLVFTVTGNVDSGTYLDISIPCGSGNYDAIVPKNAVRKDNGGNFVMMVTSKSSPLGNRYYVDRVPVEVIVSDETSSAVQGDINYGDYVITAWSKPIDPGDQVRMKE